MFTFSNDASVGAVGSVLSKLQQNPAKFKELLEKAENQKQSITNNKKEIILIATEQTTGLKIWNGVRQRKTQIILCKSEMLLEMLKLENTSVIVYNKIFINN